MKGKIPESKKHPMPPEFSDWWYPTNVDPKTGVSIGGHPEASRIWARPCPDGYERRRYGITAQLAWNCQAYRIEYDEWLLMGSPPLTFESYSLPLSEQKKRWAEVTALLRKIGRVAPIHPKELQDAKLSGERRTLIDVEDLPEEKTNKPERPKDNEQTEEEGYLPGDDSDIEPIDFSP
jgi:hypothetical protein